MSKKILLIGDEKRIDAFKNYLNKDELYEIDISDGDEEEEPSQHSHKKSFASLSLFATDDGMDFKLFQDQVQEIAFLKPPRKRST